MPGGTGLVDFQRELPDRYFDVGIAEEHAALFAAAWPREGFKPFLAIYSTFMQRAYDMIIHDMALQNLPVASAWTAAASRGDDGPTHHGLFDIGYLRHVPGLIHMQPKDEDEFVDMLWTMANYDKRPHRHPLPARQRHRREAEGAAQAARNRQGRSRRRRHATSPSSASARCSRWRGGRKKHARSAGHLGRLHQSALHQAARHRRHRNLRPQVKVVCTFEDHVLHNGFGCAVIEHLHDAGINTPVDRIGWPDQFVEHGNVPALRKKHGLTAEAAVAKVLKALGRSA